MVFGEVSYQEMLQTTEAEENRIDEDRRPWDHEEQKKRDKFKELFTRLDNMTVEQISKSAKQWGCPLCIKGPGSNKKYATVWALVQHAQKKPENLKSHRDLARILEEELRRRGVEPQPGTTGVAKILT